MVKILTLKLLGSQALTSGQTQEIFVILIITNITIAHSLREAVIYVLAEFVR